MTLMRPNVLLGPLELREKLEFSKILQNSCLITNILFICQKLSGFFSNNVRDPRSQDPNFWKLCNLLKECGQRVNSDVILVLSVPLKYMQLSPTD